MSSRQPDVVWIGVFSAVAAAIAVAERRGLKHPEYGHTATATWKRWLGISPRKRRAIPCAVAFCLVLVWFAAHIVADGDWVPWWISLKVRDDR
jgi:hypothetical protein